MISDAYEQCRAMIKRINTILEDQDSAPDTKLLHKALGRKLGSLKVLILNFELGYDMNEAAYDVLRDTERLLGVGTKA